MGYILNDEGNDLLQMVREFAEKEVKPYAAEFDRTGEFPMEMYKKGMEMGLHALEIPAEYGGGGLDYITCAAISEELAKADAGFSTGISAVGLALKPVLFFGTPEQKKMFSDIVVNGGMACFALTEPDAGSDAGATKTTAVRDGDEYVINGSKCFITGAAHSDVMVVFATVDKSKGLKGVTAFIVEANRPGISIGKEEDKMGIRLSNTASISFDDVRVPVDHRLGAEGEGFKIAMVTLDASRPFVGAGAVGIAQRALDEAVKYAKERIAFGKPIANLQAIQFMLADMDIKIETARQMIIHALTLIESKKPHSRESAIAKCYAGDIAMQVTTDAVQILAGYGYSREYPVEKLMRDAKIFQIFEGTNQIQRVVIAGNLLRK
ncbi:acyl-CoA dehydrogenase family protein [Papillibacter cinnamivorans]|uniref:Butyryl-CoA dehydrogenase n=1 Tax=Papillibacter cinnamivorans DSM 12816 TaxID=1122930 RepID=A0A1W2D1W0_9FIRM|nr:acyl-CoA dehydrogenase family protein [Papillibacter cinnamivorans]SMC91116.1 butyryl-CoA dehydrogenase [Papillibacter cinnamivorans DSM 12816]